MTLPDPTLSFIAQYVPHLNKGDAHAPPPDREYTIDELARATETTTRNIRAYQERGLLPPPKLRGRKGIYSNAHYSRLRLIGDLLERGYTLSTIGDLLAALEQGLDLRNFMGIESALTSPWTDEEPVLMGIDELLAMFDNKVNLGSIDKALKLDLVRLEPDGKTVQVRSMRTMKAGAELVSTGIPFEDLLEIIQMLRGNVERVANELVKLVAENVLQKYDDDDALPPKEDLPQIADLIWRLRPLAEMAVHAELARAMEKATNHFLGDRLEKIIQGLETKK
ncbi:MerR family transcriptional regulator [Oleiphilus messinensis]|uniref:MerR family transcriptional regulator n=1 Tax=Oleiphilus messinensis TaxID=141451 RepID=A0A1Y0IEJ6_9GAMM|nr:MerR family transcriptional regulator [Oleiphilus messinensis]ARU57784.1 MerR family transcriptional regulator [Oleiphilus messinensis]